MLHPIFHRTDSIYYYTGLWIIIAVTHTCVLYFFQNVDLDIAITDSLIFNALFGAIGLSTWYVVRYNDISDQGFFSILINHLAALALCVSVWLSAGYYILTSIFEDRVGYFAFMNSSLVWRAISGVLFYFLLVLIYYLIVYYKNLQEKMLNEQKLNILVKEAELNALKSQINPHFLFNSLNSISSFTITDPEKAQDMVIKLSSFLRYSLGLDEKQKTTLKNELNNCRLYLDIEKVRFGEKLEFSIEVADEIKDLMLPNMILQPLFENAVKYGVYDSTDHVIIDVKCRREDEFLVVAVRNNFDPDSKIKRGEGVGLKNIRSRLNLIYNRNDLLKINKKENIYESSLYIPQ